MLRKNYIPSMQKSSANLLELPNCIALTDTGKCKWLNVSVCQGTECSFKQNKQQAEKSFSDYKSRLSSLETDEQIKIAKRYYSGFMPWNE